MIRCEPHVKTLINHGQRFTNYMITDFMPLVQNIFAYIKIFMDNYR